MASSEAPITGIVIVADKNKAPPSYEVLTKSHDEPSTEADVWKDSMFSFSRVYRYVAISRTVPPNAFVCNVVCDVCLVNDKDVIPPGFVPLEYTEDTREKALRKKQLCVRVAPRETAVDAVSDVVILARQRRPPAGYTLAGDVDGLMIAFKYSTIPPDFGRSGDAHKYQQHGVTYVSGSSAVGGGGSMYPSVPYDPRGTVNGGDQLQGAAASLTLTRQTSVKTGVDDVPFSLHPLLNALAQRRDGSSAQDVAVALVATLLSCLHTTRAAPSTAAINCRARRRR